jgi:hypothetical protein
MKKLMLCVGLAVMMSGAVSAQHDWVSGIPWEKPKVVTPGDASNTPPSDAVILFDGKDASAWNNGENWPVKDGVLYSGKGPLSTKQEFGSVQLHLEFATPSEVKGSGQGRGNSGVFFMDHYEVQILDSYESETYFDGQCAAIYKQSPPIVNACKKPGEWQSYDIIFNRPELKIKDGKIIDVVRPAFITVLQNGVLVQNHFAIEGDTFYHRPPVYQPHGEKGHIQLQDHGNPIRFRNIWVREIPDTNAKPAPTTPPFYRDAK